MSDSNHSSQSPSSAHEGHRSGFAALMGRPNVGKSTLLNRLVGVKVSITAHKPQTTRHRITGIAHLANAQVAFVDTPGVHDRTGKALNRYMNKVALATPSDVDVVLLLVEASGITAGDRQLAQRLLAGSAPVVMVVNKIDRLKTPEALLPMMEEIAAVPVQGAADDSEGNDQQASGKNAGNGRFAAIVPISALKGDGVDALLSEVLRHLPEGPAFFDDETVTDRSRSFLAGERVREQLTRNLHQELPYALTVDVQAFEEDHGDEPAADEASDTAVNDPTDSGKSAVSKRSRSPLLRIACVIWVERDGHKGIVIGQKGSMLKKVGSAARKDLERLFDQRVHLELWVKVREAWSDDEQALARLGFDDV